MLSDKPLSMRESGIKTQRSAINGDKLVMGEGVTSEAPRQRYFLIYTPFIVLLFFATGNTMVLL